MNSMTSASADGEDGKPLPKWMPKATYFNLLSKSVLAEQLIDSEALLAAAYEQLQEQKVENARLQQQIAQDRQGFERMLNTTSDSVTGFLGKMDELLANTALVGLNPVDKSQFMSISVAGRADGSALNPSTGLEIIGAGVQEACCEFESRLDRTLQNGRGLVARDQERERAWGELTEVELPQVRQALTAKARDLVAQEQQTAYWRDMMAQTEGKMARSSSDAAGHSAELQRLVLDQQARLDELQAAVLELNDTVLAHEEDAHQLRKFVTSQASGYRAHVHAELVRRFGFVPNTLDQFFFDAIPPPALGADYQPENYTGNYVDDDALHYQKTCYEDIR